LANFYYGNLVHELIGEDFESRGFGVSDRPISELLGVPSIFGRLRPDLTTIATAVTPGEVYEIKSVTTGAQAAAVQLGLYLVVLNSIDPHKPKRQWIPGVSYYPPSIITLGNGAFALVSRPGPGIILYEVIDIKELTAIAAAASVAALAEIETDIVVGMLIQCI